MANAQLLFDFYNNEAQPLPKTISRAIEKLATTGGAENRGAIFTRSEVVDFILDLVNYVTEEDLSRKTILEPSFGGGEFLSSIVERLIGSCINNHGEIASVARIKDSIRAVELHRDTFESTRERLRKQLESYGISSKDSIQLLGHWLIQGDFLLEGPRGEFDFIVGNPPYVRQELIPAELLQEYRRRYRTLYDRADLYIPFMERSLGLLKPKGELGFICSDRWMKNRYGGPLREMISSDYSLQIYVDMVNTPAFLSDVIAYPAITVIRRDKPSITRVFHRPEIDRGILKNLAHSLRVNGAIAGVREVNYVRSGTKPWMLGNSEKMELVSSLENRFPTLEEVGCKVGIGVATGADKHFIGEFESLDVEPERKLPLAMTKDILTGVVDWNGKGVINPFGHDGQLVDLRDYPKLARYLEHRKEAIAGRHCAKKTPVNWYRTIDRIIPELCSKPKLLIPDIQGDVQIVFENGKLYPHHNLYYIVSEEWDLRVLHAILMAGIAKIFVSSYSTEMRGGYLRFQAQYLRRIRVPHWKSIPTNVRDRLSTASHCGNFKDIQKTVAELYKISLETLVGNVS